MNPKREVYFALSRQPIPWPTWEGMGDSFETSLCYFCKWAQWEGFCAESFPVCQHPLERVKASSDYAYEGYDCWGFRPMLPVDAVAEFVGQRLQGLRVELPTREEWVKEKHEI